MGQLIKNLILNKTMAPLSSVVISSGVGKTRFCHDIYVQIYKLYINLYKSIYSNNIVGIGIFNEYFIWKTPTIIRSKTNI